VKKYFILILIGSFFCLASCAPSKRAPIDNRPAPPSTKINQHIVSSGETVFSIAWQYELDYKKLAQVNKLNSSYTIYPDQRLLLDISAYRKPVVAKPRAKKSSTISKMSNQKKSTQQAITKKTTKKTVTAKSRTTKKTVTAKSKTIKKTVTAKSRQKFKAKPSQSETSANLSTLPKYWRWEWPVKGRSVKKYDTIKQLKGIYIYAKKGVAVKAAGPGVVVYAGSGLRGYGNLIIIKHSALYLSAYAQNQKIFVKEGSVIKVGQKIAQIGGDSEDPNRFYFEIRKDGKTVNPLKYLPKK
jgi:lipoprotein NlpD